MNQSAATGWGAPPSAGDVGGTAVSSAWSNTPGAPGVTTTAIGSTNQPGTTGLERNHQNIANAWGSDPTSALPGQGTLKISFHISNYPSDTDDKLADQAGGLSMPGVGIGTIPQLGQPSGLNTPTSMGQLGTQLGSLPTSQVGQLGGLGSVNPLGK